MPALTGLEKQASAVLLKRERQYATEVQAALREALDKMRADMVRIYDRYAVNGLLSRADMTRYNRLVTMEKQLLGWLDPAIKENLKTIARLRPEQYQAAFFHSAWAVDNAAQVRLSWGLLNKDVLMENIANRFYKISTDTYGTNAGNAIRSALNEGLSQGKSFQAMARDLKKAINTTYHNAIRIIRTEGQTAVNAGTDDAYTRARAKGIDLGVVWDATLDGKTRPEHGAVDGKIRDENGMFTVGGEKGPYPAWEGFTAAQRINCRCRLRAEIDGYSPMLRRTRDQGLIPYQTYDQWAKDHKTTLSRPAARRPVTPARLRANVVDTRVRRDISTPKLLREVKGIQEITPGGFSLPKPP